MSRRDLGDGRMSIAHLTAVLALAFVFGLWRGLQGDAFTNAVEDRLLDLRFRLRGELPAPPGLVLVTIDEATVDRLGWSPPPRWALADGVEQIIGAGAEVVAIDLLLVDQTAAGPELAATLASSDRIVLAAAVTNAETHSASPRPVEVQAAIDRSSFALVIEDPRADFSGEAPHVLLPRADIVGGATLAHVNVARSADRVVRRAPLSLWVGEDRFLPAMALEAARRMLSVQRADVMLRTGEGVHLGERSLPTDRSGSVTVNHYGRAGAIASVNLLDVLDGRVPAETFAGRAVFVGATAESLSDLFATPYSADVPGVEIIATMAGNLLDGTLIAAGHPAQLRATLLLAMLLTVLVFLTATRRSAVICYLGTGAAWLIGALAVQIAFSRLGAQLDAVTILVALLLATGWTSVLRFRSESAISARATRERRNLARYVPPLLAERLASGDISDIDRRTQNAAILFVDVAGYTALVENLAPDRTAAFLRGLHELFDYCAAAEGGVIANFAGDGAMIVFGLPEPAPHDAASALACGVKLLDEAERFGPAADGERKIALRVSVHFGPVAAAILGSDQQAQITVTGDTVNLASRLQEVAKERKASFVASRETLDAALAAGSAVAARFAPLAEAHVRGRKAPVEVWKMQPSVP